MKMYFSGIAGKTEAEMLRQVGVERVLVDSKDLKNSVGFKNIVLDSGAYRVFKKGGSIDIVEYCRLAQSYPFDFVAAPDVIGNPIETELNWQKVKHIPNMVPVWQWGSERELLSKYLNASQLVAIGGLVNLMREKNETMLNELSEICSTYPNRFHIFGINWLKAIERLKGTAYSGDTSKWLDGARYKKVIFIHTKNGHLYQLPIAMLGLDYDRTNRCLKSAEALLNFCA
jgi:hypothetical protein